MRFTIDIGHVPNSGSKGLHGFDEYLYCSRVAMRLAELLRGLGDSVTIVDKPHLANNPEISAVISAINAQDPQPDLILALHTNHSPNAEARGAQVYYASEGGKLAAGCVAHHLVQLLPGRAHATEKKSYAMLTKTRALCIYFELGFSSNAADHRILTEQFDHVVAAIMQGLCDYKTIRKGLAQHD